MSTSTIPPAGKFKSPDRQSDALPDQAFEKTINRILSLVAGIINVPFVFVTLQDKTYYSFKANEDLEFNQAEWETFCPYPPDSSKVIIVPDTLQNTSFALHNPFVTNLPYIRFYANVTLQTKAGLNTGRLYLLDRQPRSSEQVQPRQLTDLAALVMEVVEGNLVTQNLQRELGEAARRKDHDEALKKSEKQYRTLARNFPNTAVFMYDHNLRFILAEGSILNREQIGYSKQDLEGKTIWEVLTPEKAEELGPVYQKAFDGQETVFERVKGSRIYLVQILPARDEMGGIYAGLILSQEITERKQVEQKLRLALEKEKELGEMKNRLITTTSHEFRTPLSAIISSTELLEHYSQRWSEEKKQEILTRISKSAGKLTSLIEDILIYNRAEKGKLGFTRSRVNLPAYCQELVKDFQLNASNGVTVRLVEKGERQDTYLDVELLNNTLVNLLSNAIKYSKPGGQVTLELEWQPDELILRVEDEGIGIPLQDQAGLFEPFQRASNVEIIGGTGLGLAIVKQSVLAHKGHIRLDSVEGQGTISTVRLPLKDYSDPINQPGGQQDEPGPEKKIDIDKVTNNWWLLEQAIEASSSGFMICDPGQEDSPIIYTNKGFEKITGFLSEEVLGKNPRFLEAEDLDQPGLREIQQAVKEERECRVILRYYHKDGHLLWIELHISPVRNLAGKVLYYVGIQNDVSDRVRVEAALNQSEQKFKALVENSPDLISRFDRNNRYLYVNPTLERISGGQLTAAQVIGKNLAEIGVTYNGIEDFEGQLQKVFKTGKAASFEIRPILPGGNAQYFQVRFVPELSSDGKEVLSVLTVGRDITELREINEALRESERRLSEILESITDAFFTLDTDWNLTHLNHQTEKLLQRSGEELRGRNIWEMFPDAGNFRKMYQLAREEMKPVNFEEYYAPLATWFEVNAYPSAGGLSVYFQDISKRKKIEEALLRSEQEYRSRMEQAPDAI